MANCSIAYGKKESINAAIENNIIPKGTMIITENTSEILFYDHLGELKPYQEKYKFSSCEEAEGWVQSYGCQGQIFSIHEDGECNVYIVNYDGRLCKVSVLSEEEKVELLNSLSELSKSIEDISKDTTSYKEEIGRKLSTLDKSIEDISKDTTSYKEEIGRTLSAITDYLKDTLTEEDKQEIIEETLSQIPDADSIVDVTSLPASDIQEHKIYRLTTASIVYDRYVQSFKVRVVDSLPPTTSEPATIVGTFTITAYYALDTKTAHGYIDQTLSEAYGLSVGWHDISEIFALHSKDYAGIIYSILDDPMDSKFRILINRQLFYYSDRWLPTDSCSWEGTGSNSLILNTPSQTVSGFSSLAVNANNKVTGSYSFAANYMNVVVGNYSTAMGYNTINEGHFAHTFNHSTKVYPDSYYQTAFGHFNRPSPDSLLSVGNGTSETDRMNAFEIKDDGTIVCSKVRVKDSATNKEYDLSVSNGLLTLEEVQVNV